jgi:flagellar basal-body rod protein FlgB
LPPGGKPDAGVAAGAVPVADTGGNPEALRCLGCGRLGKAAQRVGTAVAMSRRGFANERPMKIPQLAPHVQALKTRELRNEVLSSNLANADTPNYRARDVDFGQALRSAHASQLRMAKTSASHSDGAGTRGVDASVTYRTPTQSSLDGNTVDVDVEQAAFAENAVAYQASLTFLNGQIRTLRLAIKGSD